MIATLLLVQAASIAVPSQAEAGFTPYRHCLDRQIPSALADNRSDEAILDQARSKCFSTNLSGGSSALFAEIERGASREDAIARVAGVREAIEQEALAAARAKKSKR